MCTALVFFKVLPDAPLLIAANRDEFLNRPASAPNVFRTSPRVIAGTDLHKGGTWFGVSAKRFIALLTNQAPKGALPPSSRGDIVARVLELADHERALAYLQSLDPSRYRGFNLLFGDLEKLSVAYAREGEPTLEFESVTPGFHVLPNGRLDDLTSVKVQRARALLPTAFPSWVDAKAGCAKVLAQHETPAGPLSSFCVHTPFYGTVSSQIVALSETGVLDHSYVGSRPCKDPPQDLRFLHI